MAGESAGDLARRQRERAERLMRSAEMYERGAEGERTTGAILDSLRAEGWGVFHDLRWPGRQRANIDHVVVGPPGIFVIDSKNWAGRIEVGGNTFRCNGRRRDKTVAAAGDAALAVAAELSAPSSGAVRSVLCFVRDEAVAGWCYDVMVCSTANLREMLLSRPAVLTPEDGQSASAKLASLVVASPAGSGRMATTPRPTTGLRPSVPVPRPTRRTARATRKKAGVAAQLARAAALVVLALILLAQGPRLGGFVANLLVPQPATSYASCKALRQAHPYGVGTTTAVDRLKRSARLPDADVALYDANSTFDRDHDGLVCERPR